MTSCGSLLWSSISTLLSFHSIVLTIYLLLLTLCNGENRRKDEKHGQQGDCHNRPPGNHIVYPGVHELSHDLGIVDQHDYKDENERQHQAIYNGRQDHKKDKWCIWNQHDYSPGCNHHGIYT